MVWWKIHLIRISVNLKRRLEISSLKVDRTRTTTIPVQSVSLILGWVTPLWILLVGTNTTQNVSLLGWSFNRNVLFANLTSTDNTILIVNTLPLIFFRLKARFSAWPALFLIYLQPPIPSLDQLKGLLRACLVITSGSCLPRVGVSEFNKSNLLVVSP